MNRGVAMVAVLVLFAARSATGTESRGDAFSAAAKIVGERTGTSVGWSEDRRERSSIADTVRALLREPLTVERAVRVALLSNRGLKAALEEIGISRADYRQALLPRNPAVEGEIRLGSGRERPGELVVMQDLISILLVPLRRRVANGAVRQATLRAADAALELAAETRAAFYDLQAAGRAHALWGKVASAAQAGADLALRQHEVGNITDLDVENEQALYEQAKVELARSQVEVLAARERVNRAMGTWGEQVSWSVADELPDLPPGEGSLEGLEAQAVSQRLDLAALAAEVRTLAQAVPLARYSQFFELRAGLHFEREPEGARTTGPAVEIAIPLFDRGQAAVSRAEAQLRQAEDRYAALAIEIRSHVRAARDRLASARQRVEYYRDVVLPRRQRIVDQTQLQFNGMLVGVYQLLQARQGQISAEREYIEDQRDYWVARAQLERVLGGPLLRPSE